MKARLWKAIAAVAVTLMMTLSVSWNAVATPQRHDYELEGTWLVTVTQKNCSTGATLSAFHSILTFADGGSMAEDTTNPAFGPGQRGSGQGYWRYEGRRAFYAKSIAFINYTTASPNPPMVPPFKAGTQTIEQTIEFTHDNPDEWDSTATVKFLDSNGVAYSPSPVAPCITAVGVRFK